MQLAAKRWGGVECGMVVRNRRKDIGRKLYRLALYFFLACLMVFLSLRRFSFMFALAGRWELGGVIFTMNDLREDE